VEFLNVLAIKKIAFRKGCSAERTATIKYKHYVPLTGPDGTEIEGARGVGLGLHEAKRRLEAMPDLAKSSLRVVDRKRREADAAPAPTRMNQRGSKAAAPRASGETAKPITRRSRTP
jgi:hypothetical protein